MALDFPSPSTTAEVSTGDITWKWNGYAWYATTDATQVIHVGVNPPTEPRSGQMWWCSATTDEGGGRLYVYFDNVWVDASLPGGGSGGPDGDFLSKTEDDTAAGAITFQGLTTHEGGLSTQSITATSENVTYTTIGTDATGASNHKFSTTNTALVPTSGLISSAVTLTGTQKNLGTDTNPCGIRSSVLTDASFDAAGSSFICAFQSRVGGTTGALGGDYFHYYAPNKRSSSPAVERVHGFHSGVGTSDATYAYQFYASGTAPSVFNGKILCGVNFNAENFEWALNPAGGGIFITTTSNQYANNKFEIYSNWRDSGVNRAIVFSGATSNSNPAAAYRGAINISQTGVTTAGFTIGYRSDPRELTLTPIQNATSLIKNLSPGLEGFLAPDLGNTLPHAVIGEENATQDIGTYTDTDGTVQYNLERPEVIPYGATWEKTGTEDLMQQADLISLVPILTKALQEALNRIEALESNEVVDDATDSALLTLVANLSTRVTALEGA